LLCRPQFFGSTATLTVPVKAAHSPTTRVKLCSLSNQQNQESLGFTIQLLELHAHRPFAVGIFSLVFFVTYSDAILTIITSKKGGNQHRFKKTPFNYEYTMSKMHSVFDAFQS
jgi:hypothetical protein